MITFTLVALDYSSDVGENATFEGNILYKKIEWPVIPAIGSQWVLEPIDKNTGIIDSHEHNPFSGSIDVEMRVSSFYFKNLANDPTWSKNRPT